MIVPPRPQNVCEVNDEGSYGHNPFYFGAWLRFDAAAVTKIKISPGTRFTSADAILPKGHHLSVAAKAGARQQAVQPP